MKKMMRKIWTLVLIATLVAVWAGAAGAAERIVQLTVPGCFS
jgi:hypothetical protein